MKKQSYLIVGFESEYGILQPKVYENLNDACVELNSKFEEAVAEEENLMRVENDEDEFTIWYNDGTVISYRICEM